MSEMSIETDELGPHKVLHVFRSRPALRAIVVIDNVACGPALGGIRMAPDVSLGECRRLARAMTLKNAAAGLAHGGGKSVIFADPTMPVAEKEAIVRAFAGAIAALEEYVAGPDMGTDERAMAWIADEIGRVAGLPRELGGIPLDEIGATGLGCAVAAEVAAEMQGLSLKGARVAIQGFGAVGRHAARQLVRRGAIVVAASDSRGTLLDADGIDIEGLMQLKKEGGSVLDCGRGRKAGPDAIVGADCDIWIPAARPDVINEANVGDLKARIVIQGANIPATAGAEAQMHVRGILNVPDFVANAGGVIAAATEYHGGTEEAALDIIRTRIRQNVSEVLERARRDKREPRAVAVDMASERVRRAMALRRWA